MRIAFVFEYTDILVDEFTDDVNRLCVRFMYVHIKDCRVTIRDCGYCFYKMSFYHVYISINTT